MPIAKLFPCLRNENSICVFNIVGMWLFRYIEYRWKAGRRLSQWMAIYLFTNLLIFRRLDTVYPLLYTKFHDPAGVCHDNITSCTLTLDSESIRSRRCGKRWNEKMIHARHWGSSMVHGEIWIVMSISWNRKKFHGGLVTGFSTVQYGNFL